MFTQGLLRKGTAFLLVYLASCYVSTVNGALDCFICESVGSADDCHHVDVCKTDTQVRASHDENCVKCRPGLVCAVPVPSAQANPRCFTEVSGTAGNLTFTYGCKEESACLATSSSDIVGRRDSTTDCHQCCAQPACNKVLCSHISPIHTPDNSTCEDSANIDCETISSLFHVCDDIHHAKQVCKKWCGLCDLVDGQWGSWASWTGCSVTCENGTRTRNRSCDNPAPAHGGLDCVGDAAENKGCSLDLCPVHGQWSGWEDWTKCSESCGYGLTKRVRFCNNPPPDRFGQHCFGEPDEVKLCHNDSCVVDGGWSVWSEWSTCSSTCGIGMTSQVRSCDLPKPGNGGQYCVGDHHKYTLCKGGNHCIDAAEVFTAWSEWYPCQGNIRYRNRTCFVFNDVFTTELCNGTQHSTMDYRMCGTGVDLLVG